MQNTYAGWTLRQGAGLGVLCLAVAIETLDVTMLGVAFGPITRDLNTDARGFQWIVALYALVFAAFTITGGRLGDIFGRRKIFVLGGAIFGVGSFVASISKDLPTMLVGAALIEGVGAALMAPCAASIVRATFDGKSRALAFGLISATTGACFSLGPLLGGWLSTSYSWRWGFRINVVVAAFLALGAFLFLTESKNIKGKRQLDVTGMVLSSLGVFSIVFGIIESATFGWWKAKHVYKLVGMRFPMPFGLSVTPVAIAFGLLLLSVFAWHQHRRESAGKAPLVSLSLFRNRHFSSGVLTIVCVSVCLSGLVFAVPIYLQGVHGMTAMQTGLALLPNAIAILVASAFGVWLLKLTDAKRIIQCGLLLVPIGVWFMREAVSVSASASDIQIGLIILGFGAGLITSQVFNMTLARIDVVAAGESTGISSTARQFGSSLGPAIMGTALITQMSASLLFAFSSSETVPKKYKMLAADWISSGKIVRVGSEERLADIVPHSAAVEIKGIVLQGISDGVQYSLDIAIVISVACFFVALALPRSAE